MIVIEQLPDGRTHTYSDEGWRIMQTDTGNVYDDAVDVIPHTYVETDEPVPTGDATAEELLDIILGEEQ